MTVASKRITDGKSRLGGAWISISGLTTGSASELQTSPSAHATKRTWYFIDSDTRTSAKRPKLYGWNISQNYRSELPIFGKWEFQ
jgi:hypothetical protein